MTLDNDILQHALELAPQDRADLAQRILLSLEPEAADPDADDLWAAEVEARLARAPADDSAGGDWREAIDRIRASLKPGPRP